MGSAVGEEPSPEEGGELPAGVQLLRAPGPPTPVLTGSASGTLFFL